MKRNFKEKLIRLEDFPFIKVFLREYHEEFYEEIIMDNKLNCHSHQKRQVFLNLAEHS